jgi:hypothetical protein
MWGIVRLSRLDRLVTVSPWDIHITSGTMPASGSAFSILGVLSLRSLFTCLPVVLCTCLLGRGADRPTCCTWHDAAATCGMATGAPQASPRTVCGIDQSGGHIFTALLMPFPTVEAETWIRSVDHEAHLWAFKYFPLGVAAIDCPPRRVLDSVCMEWMALASWTYNHHMPSFTCILPWPRMAFAWQS